MNDKPILVTGTDVDHEAAARVARQLQDAIERAIGVDGNIIVTAPGEGVEALRERVKQRLAIVGPGRAVEALRAMRGIERVEVVSPHPEIGQQYSLAVDNYPPQQRAAERMARFVRVHAGPIESRNQRKRRRRKARRS